MRCLITFEECNGDYSKTGLRKLDRRLTDLRPLRYSAEEQVREAIVRARRMSIQGMQPKLSAVVSVKNREFDVVDKGGRYIIKPPHRDYPWMPENEGLTMRLAQLCQPSCARPPNP